MTEVIARPPSMAGASQQFFTSRSKERDRNLVRNWGAILSYARAMGTRVFYDY
jgi:hypothetical protein